MLTVIGPSKIILCILCYLLLGHIVDYIGIISILLVIVFLKVINLLIITTMTLLRIISCIWSIGLDRWFFFAFIFFKNIFEKLIIRADKEPYNEHENRKKDGENIFLDKMSKKIILRYKSINSILSYIIKVIFLINIYFDIFILWSLIYYINTLI
jgi:hypothetical protein